VVVNAKRVESESVPGNVESPTSLRIALCFGTYPPDRNGGSDFVARFAEALTDEGATVSIITSSETSGEPESSDGRITVHRVVDDWTLGRAGRKSLMRVSRLVEEEADLVHVFFPDSVLQAHYQIPALIGLRHIPLVSTFWSLGLGRRSPMALRLQALALLARSSVVTSHDPRYLAALRRLVGWKSPVEWLPVGNNVADRAVGDPATVRARFGLEDGPLIGYFGQMDATRGLEDLFEALRIARETLDARLVMIGSSGRPERYSDHPSSREAFRRYTELPERLGVDAAVTWTPYLPDADVAALLGAVDVCALPFRANSIGRSGLAAALTLGVPVVLGGTPSTIAPLRDGRHVALVPPSDPERLAETLLDVLSNDEFRAQLRHGATAAAPWFEWRRIALTALSIYRTALVDPRRRT
jgi:glycosyltransferase involved in cell wall biosynthesis